MISETILKKGNLFFRILLMFLFFSIPTFYACGATSVAVDPLTQTINVNDTATLDITVTDVTDLYGVQVKIAYDPAILEEPRTWNGSFLEEGFATFTDGSNMEENPQNPTGNTKLLGVTLLREIPGKDGSDQLLRIEIKGKSGGTSSIILQRVRLLDSQGNPIEATIVNGQITVGGSPPGKATLVFPKGTILDTTPNYTWEAVSNSTWYKLYVNDSEGNKIDTWYTAEDAGCSSGSGSCSVEPAAELAQGQCRWWVKTYNDAGHGPWSEPMDFVVGNLPGKATLISPKDAISDTTPTYTWDAVSGATWYLLYVRDVTGRKIRQWYEAHEVGCESGTGQCAITPTTELAEGRGRWWIKTYNVAGMGPWSEGLDFYVGGSPPPANLISPSETIADTTPTYTWEAVSNSEWYKLWVDDSGGNRVQQWYKASVVCSDSTCSVTPSVVLNEGDCRWWIKTWNPAGSVWSEQLDFIVEVVP